MRKLGKVQSSVLACLQQHGGWSSRAGWVWSTYSETARVLDTLVVRGLVMKIGTSYLPVPNNSRET